MIEHDLIYINGCSFTKGHSLPDHVAWPQLLGKKFNKDVINPSQFLNDSKNGNSMDTIVTRTIQQCLSLSSKTLYVIGLTWPGRYGFHIDDIMFNWSLPECKGPPLIHGYSKASSSKSTLLIGNLSKDEMKQVYADRVCELSNGYTDFLKKRILLDEKFMINENLVHVRKILELQNFFKVQGVDYIFVNFNNMLFSDFLDSELIKLFVKQLDVSRILDIKHDIVQKKFFNFRDINIKRYDREYEIIKGNNHPSKKGHEQICEKVYDFINR